MIVYLSAMVKYLFSVLIYGLYMERSLELQDAGFCDGSPYKTDGPYFEVPRAEF